MVKTISSVKMPAAMPSVTKEEAKWSKGQVALLSAVAAVAVTVLSIYGVAFARSVYDSNISADLRHANSEGFHAVKNVGLAVGGAVLSAAGAVTKAGKTACSTVATAAKDAKDYSVDTIRGIPAKAQSGLSNAQTFVIDTGRSIATQTNKGYKVVAGVAQSGVDRVKSAYAATTGAVHAGLTELFGTRPLNNATCLTTATNETLQQTFVVGNNCDKQFSLLGALKFWK